MGRDDLWFVKHVGGDGDDLVLATVKRPELPTFKPIPVTNMIKWIDVILRHDVLLSGPAVERKHHEENIVPEKMVLHVPIKRDDGSVVLGRVGRALLEIDWEEREPI